MALSKGFITTAGTTALDARLFEQGLLVKNVNDIPRAGLLYGDPNPVKATASMNVTIADQTVFALTRGNTDGVAIIVNAGLVTLAVGTAPSSNSRFDVVWVKHNDTEKGDANSTPTFGISQGTAAASPTVPAVPAGALALATLTIPAGVTSTSASGVVISNYVPGTSLLGSPIRYRSVAEMRADTANVIDGTSAYIKGGGQFYLRGGIWNRVDGIPLAVVQLQQGSTYSISSGTTLQTLTSSSPAPNYYTSDTSVFAARSDGVVGPITVPGWYDVTANVVWTTNATGERHIEITQNDSVLTPNAADRRAASGPTNQSVSTSVLLSTGDFVKLKGWQSSGGSLFYLSRLSVKLVQPS